MRTNLLRQKGHQSPGDRMRRGKGQKGDVMKRHNIQ